MPDLNRGGTHTVKRFPQLALAAAIISLAGILAACTSQPASTLDVAAVRAYADAATETALQGLSEGDLEKYTRDANEEFKQAVTQEVLDTASTQVGAQWGTFQSIEFLGAEESEGYVVVHYRATYSRGKMGVRMVFDADQLVAGQWFE